jgi:hypothetical protein
MSKNIPSEEVVAAATVEAFVSSVFPAIGQGMVWKTYDWMKTSKPYLQLFDVLNLLHSYY